MLGRLSPAIFTGSLLILALNISISVALSGNPLECLFNTVSICFSFTPSSVNPAAVFIRVLVFFFIRHLCRQPGYKTD